MSVSSPYVGGTEVAMRGLNPIRTIKGARVAGIHMDEEPPGLEKCSFPYCSWKGKTAINPTSRLLLHILATVAEFESELIRERVSAGFKHAKVKGAVIGSPRRVFGRQKVLDMRQRGMSYPQIARALGLGYGTVTRGIGFLSKTRPVESPEVQGGRRMATGGWIPI
jgi:hypothetical protein